MIRGSKNSARKSSREPARFRSTVDSNGRTIFVADTHRGDGKRFVVRADEKLTAFVELESAIWRLTSSLEFSFEQLSRDWQDLMLDHQ
jgi:hypothetical protein